MTNHLRSSRLVALLGLTLIMLSSVRLYAIIDASLQMQLGNPSGATADPTNHSHYLIQRTVEALDYNDAMGQPNWASWDYTVSDSGSSGRSSTFFTDNTLPAGFTNVNPNEYPGSGSGYDRGHMCPSGDRTDNTTDNDLVFYMSNIIPQASDNNQGLWATFETYCRSQASSGAGNEILLICGPGGFTTNRIANGKVAIPTNVWKVAVIVPLGSGAAATRITTSTRVIAIETPNTNSLPGTWTNYITSAAQIERDTGLTFFTALAPTLASAMRSRIDGLSEPAPTISGFSPATGNAYTNVVITGNNFDSTMTVSFNGVDAVFSVDSTTQITALVPTNATSGHISVTTPAGTATSTGNFSIVAGASADLAISTFHSQQIFQADAGDSLSIIVTNNGTTTHSGLVTVSNALPPGFTYTGFTGSGWAAGANLTWTRTDSLSAASAFPTLNITFSVAANCPAIQTNIAYLSAAVDTNTANNGFSDVYSVGAAGAPIVTTTAALLINSNSATLGGMVNASNKTSTAVLQYGLTTNYGSSINLGTATGNASVLLSANVTGLAPSTQYHYQLFATNSLGGSGGGDLVFTTLSVGAADLAVFASHSGNFTQGDTADSFTINVTNVGNLASSGTVTVVDSLPAGLTVTGITGAGWTLNTNTLTFTRSDSLGSGVGYPAIILTFSVATNAPANVTNLVSISGGGDSNSANNSASDPTVINPFVPAAPVVLAGWDVSTITNSANNFGPSPLPATTNAPNVLAGGLTRGTGVGQLGSNPANHAWGGTSFTNISSANAIGSNQFVTCNIAASNGFRVSYSSISKFDYRKSNTGATNGLVQYQVGSGSFTDITTVSYAAGSVSSASLPAVDLSGITSLQNVGPGTNVTFRIVNWGGSGSTGTWYINDTAGSSAPDFAISGTVTPVQNLTPIQTWRQQYFGTTNNSGAAADTAVASADGMPNLLKYALNLNPLVAAANPVTGDISTGYLRLNVPKNPNATDITYSVEAATDLATGNWSTSGTIVDVNSATLLQVRYGVPIAGSSRAFLRLKVTRP